MRWKMCKATDRLHEFRIQTSRENIENTNRFSVRTVGHTYNHMKTRNCWGVNKRFKYIFQLHLSWLQSICRVSNFKIETLENLLASFESIFEPNFTRSAVRFAYRCSNENLSDVFEFEIGHLSKWFYYLCITEESKITTFAYIKTMRKKSSRVHIDCDGNERCCSSTSFIIIIA